MKTVLITGANRGIGLGLVKYYLGQSYNVIATCRQPDTAKHLTSLQCETPDQVRLDVVELDVSDENSIHSLPERLACTNNRKLEGRTIDLVFNNAGISIDEPFNEWSFKQMLTSFTTNAIGPAMVIQAIAPLLRRGSKVIQVSSGRASLDWNQSPEDGLDGYGASKAALNMFSRRLAKKLKPKDIIVASISPGWVKTDTGGDAAPTTVDTAVEQLAKVAAQLTLEHSGLFFSEEGVTLPY